MTQVLVPLAAGFEEIEVVTIVDVLRRGDVVVTLVSLSNNLDVRGAHGMVLRADTTFEKAAAEEYQAIALPGGGEGTQNLLASQAVLDRLLRQKEAGLILAAICAAPTVLAAAGVIEQGQHVTCYPSCRDQMLGVWVDQPVVEHDTLITSQSPGTSMLFALVLLKNLAGDLVARKVAKGLVTSVFG